MTTKLEERVYYTYPDNQFVLCKGCTMKAQAYGNAFVYAKSASSPIPRVSSTDFDEFTAQIKHYAALYDVELPTNFGQVSKFKFSRVRVSKDAVHCRYIMPSTGHLEPCFKFQFDIGDPVSFNDAVKNALRLRKSIEVGLNLVQMYQNELNELR